MPDQRPPSQPGEEPETAACSSRPRQPDSSTRWPASTFMPAWCGSTAPHATLVIVPVIYGDGAADETVIIDAPLAPALWHWVAAMDSTTTAGPLDIIGLSLGYLHEDPGGSSTSPDSSRPSGPLQSTASVGRCRRRRSARPCPSGLPPSRPTTPPTSGQLYLSSDVGAATPTTAPSQRSRTPATGSTDMPLQSGHPRAPCR